MDNPMDNIMEKYTMENPSFWMVNKHGNGCHPAWCRKQTWQRKIHRFATTLWEVTRLWWTFSCRAIYRGVLVNKNSHKLRGADFQGTNHLAYINVSSPSPIKNIHGLAPSVC